MKPLTLIYVALAFSIGVSIPDAAAQNAQEKNEQPRRITISFLPTELTFDPHHTYTSTEAQLYTALYEGLVTYHPLTLEPVPAAASRWEILQGGRLYRFHLRPDGRYWNGDRVTAQHFRDSWKRLLDPDEKAEYSFLFDVVKGAEAYRTGKSEDFGSVGIRAVSDLVLEIELEQPAAHFLKILCHHSFVPIHPRHLRDGGWRSLDSVIGNGPFYIIRRNAGEMTLTRNNLYWDRRNVIPEEIRILFNEDPAEATAMYNRNEIDWLAGGIDLEQVRNRESIVVNPLFATHYWFFVSGKEPWSDPQVRRGLSLLLPWEQLREGQFIPAKSLVPPIPGYPEIQGITAQNVKEGLSILSEAGYPDGVGLPPIEIKIPEGQESQRIARLMGEAWREHLSVEVNVRVFPFSVYYDEAKKRDYTLGTMTWIGDFADPLTFLQMWTGDSNLNDPGYRNPEFDRLVRRSLSETGTERYETLAEAERIIIDSGAVLPISHTPAVNIIDADFITGWYPNPLDIHPMKFLRFGSVTNLPWSTIRLEK